MEIGAHSTLHNIGKHHSDDTRQKISKTISETLSDGRTKGEKNPMAKQCNINGKIYGCLKYAYNDIRPNMSYSKFTIKYKKGEL